MGYLHLIKGQDEETYKKYARNGMDLIYPVTIQGQTHRPDIGIRYHNSIKVFDTDKDNKEHAHERASKLDLSPPDPKEVGIEPTTLTGQGGYKMHVLRMHGPHAEKIQQQNETFDGMGKPQNYVFHPHITVDEKTWHKVKNSGAKTAHDAGIQFHNAELRHGPAIVNTYHPKLAASEKMDKGIKHVAAAMGLAGAMALAPSNTVQEPKANAPARQHQSASVSQATYTPQRMLHAIAQVESTNGQNENHKTTSKGDRAYGRYGLMPNTIRETVHMNPTFKQHSKVQQLQGDDFRHYMDDNKGLEDQIASKHLERLEHHFGQDPSKIGYAWLNGIRGTYQAQKQNKDINNHWHAAKVKDAYDKGK